MSGGIHTVNDQPSASFIGMNSFADTVNALHDVVQNAPSSNSEKIEQAHTLSQLSSALKEHLTFQLSDSQVMGDIITNAIIAIEPLQVALQSDNATKITLALDAFRSDPQSIGALTTLSDPNNWDPNLKAFGSISLAAIHQLYVPVNSVFTITMADLGQQISVRENLLDSLNKMYAAVSWNPGADFLSPKGDLIEVASTDGTGTWYEKYVEEGIFTKSNEGAEALKQMLQEETLAGLPAAEIKKIQALHDTWFGISSTQTLAQPGTPEHAKAIWTSTDFKINIDEAISGATHFNFVAQTQMREAMQNYDNAYSIIESIRSMEHNSMMESARRSRG